ncbi:hypothetical protein LY28_00881 [Ruminiclostridium sufflavum DSM 19573]|uniref:Attachment p12 family protein n=1 Tax=Ruminiclostridium sufflavum DSM 19573 TaxID=1121337 RepID=A0A318XPG1_9FIRM|nr:hypothetical protein [Ruminiclostridium sufflavum]PYG89060.1 hypothetical protein LY28_00881 [Ruminiclostridium sufflavum DSM 19573]
MKLLDYIIVSMVSIWFVAAVWFLVRAKRKGRSICCGRSCGSCTEGCEKCKKDSEENKS